MKFNKKKITPRFFSYGITALIMGSSICLLNTTNNQINVKTSTKLNKTQSSNHVVSNATDYTIRINPSNGFSDLTTPDNRFTYVLITYNSASEINGTIGGSNSGIACINNSDGNIIATWYLPNTEAFKLNYTTNIVFGQTSDGKIDPSTIFVLCGISNLAKAINSVYTDYSTYSHKFTLNVNNGPTVKIFKLSVDPNSPTNITNALGGNNFYNFAYPSDGTNGYVGFNASGNIYEPNLSTSTSSDAIYYYNGVGFSTDFQTKNSSNDRKPNWSFGSTTLVGFSSYLTYLTYGQNFAYHLGKAYGSNTTYAGRDEFIMTSAFVNVDQNIGGLYSATVHNYDATDAERDIYGSQMSSRAKEQPNWPVPFAYQWVLADIANANSDKLNYHQSSDIQYSFIDAKGDMQNVTWGNSELALSKPILSFFDDPIFFSWTGHESQNLFETLKDYDRVGSTWSLTTGYIIYTPDHKSQSPTPFNANNINEYRYFQIGEILKNYLQSPVGGDRRLDRWSCFFTNALATNHYSDDGTMLYILGVQWSPIMSYESGISNGQLDIFFTPYLNSMFCYEWEAISNDNGKGPLMMIIDRAKLNLKKSFTNWNLIYLGRSAGIDSNKIDPTFTYDSTELGSPSICREFIDNAGSLTPENLGRRLTFLRKKVSVVCFPTDNFLIFSAGTQLVWENGISYWNVKNVGTKSMSHNFDHYSDDSSMYVGTVYLPISIEMATNPTGHNGPPGNELDFVGYDSRGYLYFDQSIWSIKSFNQPYGKGGPSLVFETSQGIYTICGKKTKEFNGSLENVLMNCGSFRNDSVIVNNAYFVISIFQFSALNQNAGNSNNNPATPYVKNFNGNLLSVENNAHDIYSAQNNEDYLILDNGKDPNVFGSGDQWIPRTKNFFKDNVPAMKPFAKLNNDSETETNLIIDFNQLNSKTLKSLNYDNLKTYDVDTLADIILTEDQVFNYTFIDDYDAKTYGAIVYPVVKSDYTADAVEIVFPVSFKKLTYYSVTKKNNKFASGYNLTNLGSVKLDPGTVIPPTGGGTNPPGGGATPPSGGDSKTDSITGTNKVPLIAGVSSAIIIIVLAVAAIFGLRIWWSKHEKRNLNLKKTKVDHSHKPSGNLFKRSAKNTTKQVNNKNTKTNKTETVKRRSYKVTEPKLTHNTHQTKFMKQTTTKHVDKAKASSQPQKQTNQVTYPTNQQARTYNTVQANRTYQNPVASQNQYATYQQAYYTSQPVRQTNQTYYPTNQQAKTYNYQQANQMHQTMNNSRNYYGNNQNANYAYPQNNYMNQQTNNAYNPYDATYPTQSRSTRRTKNK